MTSQHPPDVQEILDNFKRAELKLVVKEAIKEWLDEQATKMGRWSIRFIALSALGALAYFILISNGWNKS